MGGVSHLTYINLQHCVVNSLQGSEASAPVSSSASSKKQEKPLKQVSDIGVLQVNSRLTSSVGEVVALSPCNWH